MIDRPENSESSVWSEGERPCREWWAVFGTVADAFEGVASRGFAVAVGVTPATALLCVCG